MAENNTTTENSEIKKKSNFIHLQIDEDLKSGKNGKACTHPVSPGA